MVKVDHNTENQHGRPLGVARLASGGRGHPIRAARPAPAPHAGAPPGARLATGPPAAPTRQVGRIEVVKIESKGKGFRRLRIRIAD